MPIYSDYSSNVIKGQATSGSPAIRPNITNPDGSAVTQPALSNSTQYFDKELEMLRLKTKDFLLLKDAKKAKISSGYNGSGTFVRFAPTVTTLAALGDEVTNQNPINKVAGVQYEVTLDNYGAHRIFGDRDYRLKYNVRDVYAKEMPFHHLETLEEILRNELITNADKVYAGDATSMLTLTATDKPDLAEINAIAIDLRTKLIPTKEGLGGRYRVLASIGVRSDLGDDPLATAVMTYNQNAKYIDNTQEAQDIKLKEIAVTEYKKALVSFPGVTDTITGADRTTSADITGDSAADVYAHHTLIYGQDAFVVGYMENMGQYIRKYANKSYLGDPLNRVKETQGWKVPEFGTAIITKVFDYISVPTAQKSFHYGTDFTMLSYKAAHAQVVSGGAAEAATDHQASVSQVGTVMQASL